MKKEEKMELRCHATHRFLMKINIEEYIGDLEKLGISQQTPIRVEIPCRKCRAIEKYEIYPGKAIFTGSYKISY